MARTFKADLHGTIFVSCDKLTTGLRHDLRLVCTSEKCFGILKQVLKRCGNRKSCRRPAVSFSHATKIVTCNSALRVSYHTFLRRRHELGMAVGEQFSRISNAELDKLVSNILRRTSDAGEVIRL